MTMRPYLRRISLSEEIRSIKAPRGSEHGMFKGPKKRKEKKNKFAEM